MSVPDARVELQIAGTWTDVTNDALHAGAIRYSWGRRGEGSQTDPAAASFALRNPDGKYSSRNPGSPYFGQLGRNTPVRLTHGGGTVGLVIPSGVRGGATTPDAATLDIVGDIDVRADLTPAHWAGASSANSFGVLGKYNTTANQRSWLLWLHEDGVAEFRWSTDGTTTANATSSQPVPFGPGERGALRATLDVNNGSGGYTVVFYTAPTMADPWVQLGTSTVTTAGTTSIFNSTAVVEVGDIATSTLAATSRQYHSIEIRNGIGGSAVANPVFSAQASGTTTFADPAGRTWTVGNGAEITSRRIRAVLEASSWTPQWGAGGHDVTTPVEAAGILRRLGQGAKALASPLRRRIPTVGAPVAYWPLEDGRSALQAYSPLPAVSPLAVSGFEFAADNTLLGSAPLPRITASASMLGVVPAHTATGQWLVACVFYWATPPASPTVLMDFATTGTAARVVLTVDNGSLSLDGYSSTGASLFSVPSVTTGFGFHGAWTRLEINAEQTGGNTRYRIGWVDVSGGGFGNDTTIAATAGTVTTIGTSFGALAADVRLGHLGVFASSNTSVYDRADDGWFGETAAARFRRLATEENVPAIAGTAPTQMGPQRSETLLTLLGECETSDGGILYEDRERAGLIYRGRTTLYSQTPRLTIPYAQLAPPLKPVDDDRHLRNDRTVSRVGGSSARAVLTSGSLSTAAPPSGVGTYDDSQTMSLASDGQCEDIAHWLLHRGTWDEARYPSVRIYLHKFPTLIPAVAALQPGDIIRITGLPAWLPPGPLDLMVEGGDEELKTFEWTVTLACSPAGPWTVAVVDDLVTGRADTDGSTLASGVTSTATSLSVATVGAPLWSTSGAELPVDIEVGGEVMRVTAISGAASPQTFTVTRSINSIVKAQSASADVRLDQAPIISY